MAKKKNFPLLNIVGNADELTIIWGEAGLPLQIRGTCSYGGYDFALTLRFHEPAGNINESNPPYPYRGTLSLLSPVDNRVFVTGESGEGASKKSRTATVDLRFRTGGEKKDYGAALSEYIRGKMDGLLLKFKDELRAAGQVIKTKREMSGLDLIPDYLDGFLKSFPEKQKDEVRQSVKDVLLIFGYSPLTTLKKTEVMEKLRNANVPDKKLKNAKAFVDYAIGAMEWRIHNPIPDHIPRENRGAGNSGAFTARMISDEVRDKLFAGIRKDVAEEDTSEIACAMALLLSGMNLADIRILRWKDISFDKKKDDLAVVKLSKTDNPSPVHDFSRPLIPACAEILRKGHEVAAKRYGKDETSELLLCLTDSEQKGESWENFVLRLRASIDYRLELAGESREHYMVKGRNGGSRSVELLKSDYDYRLKNHAGIRENEECRIHFLKANDYNNTSFLHYYSHTSPEAVECEHTLLKALSPEKKITKKSMDYTLEEEHSEFVFRPDTTHERVRTTMTVKLRPGEELSLSSLHGVGGSVTVLKGAKKRDEEEAEESGQLGFWEE